MENREYARKRAEALVDQMTADEMIGQLRYDAIMYPTAEQYAIFMSITR